MANISLLFGPMLVGVFFNMILYGMFLVQTYTYFQFYRRDIPWIKYLVSYLFIVETANTAFDMYIMYEPLIIRFGLPEATKYFPTLFASEPFVIVAVSTPIQLFFAWRIVILTKSYWIAGLVSLFALAAFAGGMWTGTMTAILKTFANKPKLNTPGLVWFLASGAADVLITTTLVISLSRRRTGFSTTDDAISRIVRMTVETCMLTALFAVGDIIFFMTMPHTALNFFWDLPLSKLYSNSLLSSLNARSRSKDTSQATSYDTRSSNADFSGRRPHMQYIPHSYEMDSHVSYDISSSFNTGRVGVEHGVAITKVFEQFTDDHQPAVHGSTQ